MMEVVFIVSPLLESMFTIKYTILYVTFCDTKSTPFKINEHCLYMGGNLITYLDT